MARALLPAHCCGSTTASRWASDYGLGSTFIGVRLGLRSRKLVVPARLSLARNDRALQTEL